MKVAFAFAAVAGLAASASAQNATNLLWEASVNGGAFSSNVSANPGDTVRVRLTASFSGTSVVVGFSGTTLQPTLSNYLGDAVGALDTSISASDGVSPVADGSGGAVPGNNGRQNPFQTGAPMTSASPAGLLTYFNDPGNVLRFAGALSTGTGSNLTRGVGLAQKTRGLLGATVYNASNSPVIFMYSFTVGASHATNEVMTASASGINLNRGTWYGNPDTGTGNPVNATIGQHIPATITIVPTPASLALLGLGGLVAGRRRR